MSAVIQLNDVILQAKRLVEGDFVALFLFGSYARGDPRGDSDVDILQVVRNQRPSYRNGIFSFSTYTKEHLLSMAGRGSLFVHHVMQEGVVISDASDLMAELRSHFQKPSSYASFRADVCAASALLDVDDSTYLRRWSGLHSLADNLLRSIAYSLAHDKGESSFSLDKVASFLGDTRIVCAHQIRAEYGPNPNAYLKIRDLLAEYCGHRAQNPFGSIEALVVNSAGVSELTVVLGLRLLNESSTPIPYEELAQTIGI